MANLDKILSDLSKEELEALAAKILGGSIANNRYLPFSEDPDQNENLNTPAKTIIAAINDIFARTIALDAANKKFLNEFNTIVGNMHGDAADKEIYDQIITKGRNFFDVLLKAWNKTESTEKLVNTELANLREEISKIVGINTLSYTFEDKLFTGPNFVLSCEPISRESISIFINGVHYDNECFDFENDNQEISWLCTDSEFEITSAFTPATEYNPIKNFYELQGEDNYVLVGTLTPSAFKLGDFYEPDEENSDKILVRYMTYYNNHKNFYQSLYDVSLINTIGTSIGDINGTLIDNYDWSKMSAVLNSNLIGDYDYSDDGRVRVKISAKDGVSKIVVVNSDNWNTYADAARVFVGNNSSVDSFDDFCNLVYGTTTNDKTWVSFFGFEVGNYGNVFMVSSATDLDELSGKPADGNWYYGWDEKKEGNERALLMSDRTFNPYVDLTALKDYLK